MPEPFELRTAETPDLAALERIEAAAFTGDRLSRRSLRHLLTRAHADVLVAVTGTGVAGYAAVLYRRGTSLARLYSIAVAPGHHGQGLGRRLVAGAEAAALDAGCAALRLEIRPDNTASRTLFEHLGYRRFGVLPDYYEDHAPALRYERRLTDSTARPPRSVPYYAQTLEFTCGPAALIMAMHALRPTLVPGRRLELRLWREATTIFMTSGHGGCGPYGLALAAHRRGFAAAVHVSTTGPLFVESVRTPAKREVLRLVHEDFVAEAADAGIPVHPGGLDLAGLDTALTGGALALVLISLYRFYGERAPHWVVVTGTDARYVYLNDPWIDVADGRTATDCINLPVLRGDFERMARYGRGGQRAAVVIAAGALREAAP
ncbi:peptidase C39 family protein [Arhodomonas aquaeolei]|uniref:peptidase C39 family protein n=1 Tax=Arhodomonas aquaeolei TaxID=2369 RepID=UPI000379E4A7|nr:peptidase C39 family protein [Arhodomonas aquaeolei]